MFKIDRDDLLMMLLSAALFGLAISGTYFHNEIDQAFEVAE